jgi:hypothetical protein
MEMNKRQLRRTRNYHVLKDAGFEWKEANQYKDYSVTKIEKLCAFASKHQRMKALLEAYYKHRIAKIISGDDHAS